MVLMTMDPNVGELGLSVFFVLCQLTVAARDTADFVAFSISLLFTGYLLL